MKLKFVATLAFAASVFLPSAARASAITFNFDTLGDNATSAQIQAYMNAVFVANALPTWHVELAIGASTTHGAVAGDHNGGNISGEYLLNSTAHPDSEFDIVFDHNLAGFSLDYVTIADNVDQPDFGITNKSCAALANCPGPGNQFGSFPADGVFYNNGGAVTANTLGNTGAIVFTGNALNFSDDGLHDVVIDNFTIFTDSNSVAAAAAVPEPASLALLGTGLVGLGMRVRRKLRK